MANKDGTGLGVIKFTEIEYVFRGFKIREDMMGPIRRYIDNGMQPGHFLTAIITNDLSAAVAHADDYNLQNIPAFVGYFYNEVPYGCHGSKIAMQKWIEKGGLNGK